MIAVTWGKPEPESTLWVPPFYSPMKQALMRLCHERKLNYREIVGVRRSRSIAWPRQELMVQIKDDFPSASLPEIARLFNRDHTTVLHAVKQVAERMKQESV